MGCGDLTPLGSMASNELIQERLYCWDKQFQNKQHLQLYAHVVKQKDKSCNFIP